MRRQAALWRGGEAWDRGHILYEAFTVRVHAIVRAAHFLAGRMKINAGGTAIMIGVYRIYIGRSWFASGRTEELLSLLDEMPEFLYRATWLPEPVPAEVETRDVRRATARIGMTQAHLLLLPSDAMDIDPVWTSDETEVARLGLRHRLPILAVSCNGGDACRATPVTQVADMVVPWRVEDVACGVQQVVEAAAGERRKGLRRLEAAPGFWPGAGVLARPEGREMAGQGGEARVLPTDEIELAYRLYKARLSGAA